MRKIVYDFVAFFLFSCAVNDRNKKYIKDFESLEINKRKKLIQDIVNHIGQQLITFLCDPVTIGENNSCRVFKDSNHLQTSKMLLFYKHKITSEFKIVDFFESLTSEFLKKDLEDFNLKDTNNLINESRNVYSSLMSSRSNSNETDLYNILIQHIENYLEEPIKCKIIQKDNEYIDIEYPRVLYVLRGHYLEYALYSIFFKTPKNK